jgi:hypothetical protein
MHFIFIDFQFFQIIASIWSSYFFNFELDKTLLISTIFFNLLIFVILGFKGYIDVNSIKTERGFKIKSFNLYLDMLITQFERFILSTSLPIVLVFVNIGSTVTSGVKRLVYDDNELDFSIKNGVKDYDNVAIKLSLIYLFFNIGLYFVDDNLFFIVDYLNLRIISDKFNLILSGFNNFYVIISLYFGVTPISFFVAHHFRNGVFKLFNYLLYLPTLLMFFVVLKNIGVHNSYFLFSLLGVSSLHFVLFFLNTSSKFYMIKNKTVIIMVFNYLVGLCFSLLKASLF